MAEPGWAQANYAARESAVRREGDVEREELDAAREWLRHLEAGGLKHTRTDALLNLRPALVITSV
jgi:hypothetical protein